MPVTSICILGRQPKLGLAELEAVYGADAVRPIGSTAAQVNGDVQLKRLGGQLKTGTVLATLNTTDFDKVIDHIRKNLRGMLRDIPEGKIKLGLSFYDFNTPPTKINASALSLKKVIKAAGRSVRVAPNTEAALSTAQTAHNQLASPVGIEFLCVRDGQKTILARLSEVQNIADYTRRDRDRPKRDAFVGMLPPKLAQIMINLSAPATDQRILDPFCGTGVVLQEAALLGHSVYGTDISERMIEYTQTNLEWLASVYSLSVDSMLETGDATTHTWKSPVGAVVGEGYLGQPMSQEPPREKLAEVMHECNGIMRDFLKNIAPQLERGAHLCIGAPAWFVGSQINHLPVLEKLKELGYDRVEFTHASNEDLIYHREDQIVGRELVVLIKK